MSKIQVFAGNAQRAVREFFTFKTRREDFSFAPMESRLLRVRGVSVSTVEVGGRKFTRYGYEQVRGARAGL